MEEENSNSTTPITITQLFTLKEYRWPLTTAIVLFMIQQLCGINAVFFYSESIFRMVGIQKDYIQYAVIITGVVNALFTIICVPLIDRFGRRPLIITSLMFIIIDFILLTFCVYMKVIHPMFLYLNGNTGSQRKSITFLKIE